MTDFTSDYDSILKDVPTGLLLGDEFRPASDGETFDVINPATGNPLVQVASVTEEDAKQALNGAVAAQKKWKAIPLRERNEILYRAFELVRRDADKPVQLQFLEMGHALSDFKAEVGHGGEFFRWFTEEAVRISDDYRISLSGSLRVAVIKRSVGPVLAITPQNFPLTIGTHRITPTLAAGCPVIIKSASKTPLTMFCLDKLLIETDVPADAISMLSIGHSANVSGLLSDGRLRKFTFTGSIEVGQMLAAKAAGTSMKVSLKLSGDALFVTLSNDDVDETVQAVNDAKFRNGGQARIAPNRFIIHESKKGAFAEDIVKRSVELKLGEDTGLATDLGSFALHDQQGEVRNLVDDAVKRGTKIEYGGKIPDFGGVLSDGYFFEPTVLADAPEDADIVREEIFGPVAAVTTFMNDDRTIEQANDAIFGLAVHVFSENLTEVLNAVEALGSGMVAVNKGSLSDPSASFGGVKQSDLGREGGFISIDEFLEEKLISLEDQSGEQLAQELVQAAASHAQQH